MRASKKASIAFLAIAAPCFSQGRVDEFLGVKNWHGTITITGTGSGSTSGGIYSDVWQFGLTSKISFQLEAGKYALPPGFVPRDCGGCRCRQRVDHHQLRARVGLLRDTSGF
jgi:hypothetical protein